MDREGSALALPATALVIQGDPDLAPTMTPSRDVPSCVSASDKEGIAEREGSGYRGSSDFSGV
jgi:hypothetical protein